MKETATLFVVKEDEELCILFDQTDPISLYETLFAHAESPEVGITQDEVLEIIEDLVPGRLRSI